MRIHPWTTEVKLPKIQADLFDSLLKELTEGTQGIGDIPVGLIHRIYIVSGESKLGHMLIHGCTWQVDVRHLEEAFATLLRSDS